MTRVRLCFHDRCFDGTASAALFYRFYREKFDANAEFGFSGMTHRAKQPWEPGLFDGEFEYLKSTMAFSSPSKSPGSHGCFARCVMPEKPNSAFASNFSR